MRWVGANRVLKRWAYRTAVKRLVVRYAIPTVLHFYYKVSVSETLLLRAQSVRCLDGRVRRGDWLFIGEGCTVVLAAAGCSCTVVPNSGNHGMQGSLQGLLRLH